MSNIFLRNISLGMCILGIVVLIGLALTTIIYGTHHEIWQYVALPAQIAFFGVLYRNYSQAVKEDRKYDNKG